VFENALERVRRNFRLRVYGYVVMPEHIHLLLSEPDTDGGPLKPDLGLSGEVHSRPQQRTLADALKSLKQGVARRLIGQAEHFWQKRYYDFNVRNDAQFVEKLHYIHCNPVKQGLCERPEDWPVTRLAARDELKSSPNGLHANASEQREHCAQPWNCPTQANIAIEWVTRDVY
jgi:REP element-mobilizing transposase RayT